MGRTPRGQTRDQVFKLVRDRLLAGSPPTVREVQQAFDFRSVQTAREHLEGLVAEGRLGKDPGKARGYRLLQESSTVGVPLLGRVPAGVPIEAVEDVEEYIPCSAKGATDVLFALRVEGESMRDAGILNGDIVVVRQQKTAHSGDIVVALVGDEATVKRLRIRGKRLELHPENPDFEPIVPRSDTFKLLGKVIEVRRRLERP